MKILKTILPYFTLTTIVIVWWKVATMTSNYAWNPKGKELLVLEVFLTTIFVYKVLLWLTVSHVGLFAIISLIRRKVMTSIISALLTALIYFVAGHWVNNELASSYFTVFRHQSVIENYVERPIIQAGYNIGPELEVYIQNRSARDRRYAISGLGKIKYTPAIKTLKRILLDETEGDDMRADALISLRSIGTKESEGIVMDFEKSGDRDVLELGKKIGSK